MNLPNALTLSRIVLSPVFMVFLLADGAQSLHIALGVFLAAAATDVCDGYLARRTGGMTSVGKLMDPVADKLLVSLALVGLLSRGVAGLAAWMVVLIIARELIITGFRSLAALRGVVIGSTRMAKVKTVLQMSLVGWFLGALTVLKSAPWLAWTLPSGPTAGAVVEGLLLWGTLVLTTASGLDYLVRNRDVLTGALR
jgi:CDP-diacylglycerol--glycerol-3-phosphate 3-phosphatidyltransferase